MGVGDIWLAKVDEFGVETVLVYVVADGRRKVCEPERSLTRCLVD